MFFFRSKVKILAQAGGLPEFSSGLIPIFYSFETTTREDKPFRLVARIEGYYGAAPVSFTLTAKAERQSSWLALVSHLVPDGQWKVVLEAVDANSRIIGSAQTPVRFSNPSPLAAQVRKELLSKSVPLFFGFPSDSTLFGATDQALAPWYDQPDAEDEVTRRLAAGVISDAEASLFRQFLRDGYVVLDDTMPELTLDLLNGDFSRAIEDGYSGYKKGSSDRIELMHFEYKSAMNMLYQPAVTDFLKALWGVDARPCQVLMFACGSQQDPHQDSIHLTSFPQGYMCGVWIALEDIQPDSGELLVYPGSHRLPQLTMAGTGCSKVADGDWAEFGAKVVPLWQASADNVGIKPVIYRPKKGQILVWHANLLHGGSLRRDLSLSRRSMVIHYFADGSLTYYDSSGQLGTQLPVRQK